MTGDLVRRPTRTVHTLLPVLRWLPSYARADLPRDLLAGVGVAALLIPESLGYAGIAGVPPEVGLYAAIAALAAYAVTGGVSILVVGPASAVAALSASLVAEMGGAGADPVALTAGLALVSGLLLVVAGLLRFGWIVHFISRPVLHAFVAGLSISIIVGQLDGLLGTELAGENAVRRAIHVATHLGGWTPVTVVVGVSALVILLVLERRLAAVPGALVVVVGGILAVWALDLRDAEGVAVLGDIPRGLPTVGLPDLGDTRWWELVAGGMALVLVGFSEGYAAATAIADRTGETVDGDQELIGSGAANVASGLLGGLAVSGSLSKSAAGQAAGARTQVSNLVAAALVVATVLFLGPVFELLPEPVVAAVVIAAVLPAADPRRFWHFRNVNRLDFAAALATFTLVLVWETLPAMIVGVVLSLAFLVRRASFPDVLELRATPAGTFVRVADESPPRMPGVAVVRFEAPLVYANAERLVAAVGELVRTRDDLRRVVLDAEMVADLDATGAEALETLDQRLTDQGVELRLARAHHRFRDQLERSGLAERFTGRLHEHIADAVVPTV